jgi:hypothetical protein
MAPPITQVRTPSALNTHIGGGITYILERDGRKKKPVNASLKIDQRSLRNKFYKDEYNV